MACAPDNPAFTITPEVYQRELARVQAEPCRLERPLVVLDAWHHPPLSGAGVRDRLVDLTGADPQQAIAVSYPFLWSVEAAGRRVVERIEQAWPSDDPERTIEVDVVGYSMGGIVARYAADLWADLPADSRPAKRLNVRRLYTIASPHCGARMARWLPLDSAARSMRPGSDMIERLNAALPEAGYQLVCYTQTNDVTVGARNTAPPGMEPIWQPGTLLLSHQTVRINPHILLDIALRLRGEAPLAGPGSRPPRN